MSDALESCVNLVAAVVALAALTIAAREPDDERAYGYQKAEYFSSGTEGGLILIAAVAIIVTAVQRLLNPEPLEAVGWGLVVSMAASAINFGVSLRLRDAGRRYESITLEADARHLYRDRGVEWHAVRTRQAAARRFVSLHVLVPGDWTVQRGHDLVEDVERDIRAALGTVTVFTHLEPREDPRAFEDIGLDRADEPRVGR